MILVIPPHTVTSMLRKYRHQNGINKYKNSFTNRHGNPMNITIYMWTISNHPPSPPHPLHILPPSATSSYCLLARLWHRKRAIGVRFPGDSPRAIHLDKFVFERRPRSNSYCCRQRIIRRRQRKGATRIPVPQFRNGTYDFDGLTNGCSGHFAEGDRDALGNCAGCACWTGGTGTGTYRRDCRARWHVAWGSGNCDIRAGEVNLTRLERVPAQRHQRMRRVDVGDLDLLRDGVAARDGRIARVYRRVVDASALRLVAGVEAVAGKPVVAVA